MITVNGEQVQAAATVAELLECLGVGALARGVAVAVDGEVVPKAQWPHHRLTDGVQVEVLSASQGG